MKNPAASSGVSEEHELPILMKLRILSTLFPDVILYRCLIAMLAYCAREITVAPKLPTPQLLFDLGTQPEYFSSRYTLYHGYQFRDAIHRHRLHQEMNVVLIHSYLQKSYLVSLLNLQTYIANYPIHRLIKHYTPVLCRKHQVVQQNRNFMALVNVLAHARTLRPKGRGIYPVEI